MEGYALFRGLCALANNAYARGCARVMRIISLGPPLDLDTVCLDQVYSREAVAVRSSRVEVSGVLGWEVLVVLAVCITCSSCG